MSSLVSVQSHDTNVLLTAGTDMRIRFWDLANPEASCIAAGANHENPGTLGVHYRLKVVEGTEVVQEIHPRQVCALTQFYSLCKFGKKLIWKIDILDGISMYPY